MNINGVEIDPERALKWTDKLSIQKFLLVILFGAGGILLWAMWEQRTAAFLSFSNDPTMQLFLGIGLGLLVLGACVSWLVAFVRSLNDALYKALRDQIADLRADVAAVEARERECNAMRIKDRSTFEDLVMQLRSAGSLPDRPIG